VYASVAGGLRVNEPGIDLALALAVGSARQKRPVVERTVAVGEVGLGGEVRAVSQVERRLDEASRLGFTHALAPSSARARPGLSVVPVTDVAEALARGLG
jgi:DNA repair protein RadA/Sms